MAILIDSGQPHWFDDTQLAASLAERLPGVDIRTTEALGNPADVVMAVVSQSRPGQFAAYPHLRLVQKLGAGVETIVGDDSLPADVRVARLRPEAPAREIAEYCLAYVFAALRDLWRHRDSQRRARWSPVPPRSSAEARIGVLGLGHIGARAATTFASLGFGVDGFSRTRKHIDGVACRHGPEGLASVLASSDFVISVLPSTPGTRNLFDAARLSQMKPGATLINVGRGDLIVEGDLLAALDAGRPGFAVLDVFDTEPLPADHPLWRHRNVLVTPHVSGWHIGDGLLDVAENYRRLLDDRPLLHEIDRQLGY